MAADNPALEMQDDVPAGSNKMASNVNGPASDSPEGATTKQDKEDKPEDLQTDLQYSISQTPPWPLCIVLGFQHYLTMLGATIAIPLLLTPKLCVGDDWVAKSEIIGTIFFVSGINTLLQTTFGVRLPIVQGGTFAFLVPALAILKLPEWTCPPAAPGSPTGNVTNSTMILNLTSATTSPVQIAAGSHNLTFAPPVGSPEHRELWQSRMREIQGAIIVASLFQVVIGISGIIGLMLRFIGPLSITPTIALIGIGLFESASGFCSKQWWIAMMTIILILLFSQYLRNVNVPVVSFAKGKGVYIAWAPVFKLFPVILAIVCSWIVCLILTVYNVFPNDPTKYGYSARTDYRSRVLSDTKWFRFPYPGQWGLPTVSVAGVFGMLAGVLASMIESIGDYYACARLAGAPPPPVHATNRGIFMEGIGCVLAGAWGSGTGTTSYSENIGAIGVTKVGSLRVVQTGAVVMIFLGILGKFGGFFVAIPDPVVGGVFMIMFGMVAAVGLSNLQFVDLNSTRNLCIIGFSLLFGLSLPHWMSKNPGMINTTVPILDQIITVLLSTSMFVGGFTGFVLDNTIPGTAEERGLAQWTELLTVAKHEDTNNKRLKCYDAPFGMRYIRKWSWAKYLPISPTFRGCPCGGSTETTSGPSKGDPIASSATNSVYVDAA